MQSNDEKQQRRAIKQQLKQQERDTFLRSLPVSEEMLRELLNVVGDSSVPCTNTFKETIAFIREHKLDEEKTLGWLQEHGAFCDCEVLNVEDKWLHLFGE